MRYTLSAKCWIFDCDRDVAQNSCITTNKQSSDTPCTSDLTARVHIKLKRDVMHELPAISLSVRSWLSPYLPAKQSQFTCVKALHPHSTKTGLIWSPHLIFGSHIAWKLHKAGKDSACEFHTKSWLKIMSVPAFLKVGVSLFSVSTPRATDRIRFTVPKRMCVCVFLCGHSQVY